MTATTLSWNAVPRDNMMGLSGETFHASQRHHLSREITTLSLEAETQNSVLTASSTMSPKSQHSRSIPHDVLRLFPPLRFVSDTRLHVQKHSSSSSSSIPLRWQFSSDLDNNATAMRDGGSPSFPSQPSVAPGGPKARPVKRQQASLSDKSASPPSSLSTRAHPSGPKPALWQSNVYPFVSPRSLKTTTHYRLPPRSEYCFRHQLERQTRGWPRARWTPEWCCVQYGVLFFCAEEEEPFLVKLCIPLKNIQAIVGVPSSGQRRGAGGLEIRYLRPTPKGQPRLDVCRCRLMKHETVGAAERVVASLMNLRDKTVTLGTRWNDFVGRLPAETTLQQLYTTLKNGALYQLTARIGSALATSCRFLMVDAWHSLRDHARRETQHADTAALMTQLHDAQDTVTQTSQRAATQIRAIQRLFRLGQLIDRVDLLERSRKLMVLLTFQRHAVAAKTRILAEAFHRTLVCGIVVDREASAKRFIQERQRRLGFVLAFAMRRRQRDAFHHLRLLSRVVGFYHEARQRAWRRLLAWRVSEREALLSRCLYRWNTAVTTHRRQQHALSRALSDTRRQVCRMMLRRWCAACLVRTQHDLRAVERLDRLVRMNVGRLQRDALCRWRCWLADLQRRTVSEMTTATVRTNRSLVASYERVTKERACFHLLYILHTALTACQAGPFRELRCRVVHYRLTASGLPLAFSLLDTLFFRRVARGFTALLKFMYASRYLLCQRRLAAFRLGARLSSVMKRHTRSCLTTLGCQQRATPVVEEHPPLMVTEHTSTQKFYPPRRRDDAEPPPVASRAAALHHVVQALRRKELLQCTIAFGRLKAHVEEANLIRYTMITVAQKLSDRGIARAHFLERFVGRLERLRLVQMTAAFTQLRCACRDGLTPRTALFRTPLPATSGTGDTSYLSVLLETPGVVSPHDTTPHDSSTPRRSVTPSPADVQPLTALEDRVIWVGERHVTSRRPPTLLLQAHRVLRTQERSPSTHRSRVASSPQQRTLQQAFQPSRVRAQPKRFVEQRPPARQQSSNGVLEQHSVRPQNKQSRKKGSAPRPSSTCMPPQQAGTPPPARPRHTVVTPAHPSRQPFRTRQQPSGPSVTIAPRNASTMRREPSLLRTADAPTGGMPGITAVKGRPLLTSTAFPPYRPHRDMNFSATFYQEMLPQRLWPSRVTRRGDASVPPGWVARTQPLFIASHNGDPAVDVSSCDDDDDVSLSVLNDTMTIKGGDYFDPLMTRSSVDGRLGSLCDPPAEDACSVFSDVVSTLQGLRENDPATNIADFGSYLEEAEHFLLAQETSSDESSGPSSFVDAFSRSASGSGCPVDVSMTSTRVPADDGVFGNATQRPREEQPQATDQPPNQQDRRSPAFFQYRASTVHMSEQPSWLTTESLLLNDNAMISDTTPPTLLCLTVAETGGNVADIALVSSTATTTARKTRHALSIQRSLPMH